MVEYFYCRSALALDKTSFLFYVRGFLCCKMLKQNAILVCFVVVFFYNLYKSIYDLTMKIFALFVNLFGEKGKVFLVIFI